MRREYVEYKENLPIKIDLITIKNYPLHWKDSIQIILVLKGSIEIGIETYTNTIYENEIEVINSDEMRWMKGKTKDNMVLSLDIDPNFFESYYPKAKDIFYYTDFDLNSNISQQEFRYIKLKEYVSILFYEYIMELNEYKEKIEDTLLKLMYHLLNNFHYLYYEGENLEEDELELERYHRIINYLNKNYMYKVSLQEIAEKEYLSPQYLSYKIKDTFGLSFNEYLNQIRVEEATKLLLSTDKSISEISLMVGFSHLRYFNRHFNIHYNMTPSDYREMYSVSKEKLLKQTELNYHDLNKGLNYIKNNLLNYYRYNYDKNITRIDIDLSKTPISIYRKPDIINLGDAIYLLEENNQSLISEIQKEINFKYGIINNLFSSDMNIYIGENLRFINWNRVENIINFVTSQNIKPIIIVDNLEDDIINSFISYFSHEYGEKVKKWIYLKDNILEINDSKAINKLHDSSIMIPYIINNYLDFENRLIFNAFDEIDKNIQLSNDTFFGGKGIFTNNGLNKASYYTFMMLGLLGKEIIYKDSGYIVTKSLNGYQILLYNPMSKDILENKYNMQNQREKKISINILKMENDFLITKYTLNKNNGSPYYKWKCLGEPKRIDSWQRDLLKRYVHPDIKYYYEEKAIVLNILTKIKPKSAVLYLLDYV